MNTEDDRSPKVSSVLAFWFSLTRWALRASGASAKQLTEDAADAVKDTLLDLSLPDGEDGPAEQTCGQPLPQLDAEELSTALHAEIERVLHSAAAAINEGPGRWSAATEERVLALFEQLGREVLEQALELRVARAEAVLRPQDVGGLWAKRYRRMLAAEGHWPPAQEAEDEPSQAAER